MRKTALAVALVAWCVWPAARVRAQRIGSSALVVRVAPVARVEPAQVALHFRMSADGTSEVTTQGATVSAWVRARPGQQIRVIARLSNLEGPDGAVAAGAVRWKGTAIRAQAGGQQAACSSGAFGNGAEQDLVDGWRQSGILTCAVTFELDGAAGLPAGLYSGVVNLAVAAQ